MSEALYSFQADLGDAMTSLWLSLFIALGALGGAVALYRSKSAASNRNYRVLGAMLLFFVFLIAAATAVFSFWTTQKIDTVYIYENAVETPYGRVEFSNLKDAKIETQRQPSLINPSITRSSSRVLIIEEEDGKKHLLSEENYDIQEILRRLREVVRKDS